MQQAYAIGRSAPGGFEQTVADVREQLAAEGFGVLTEIDIQAKMNEKLGKDMEPYLILGACAPPLAWEALQAEPDLGVLLPCNVCVSVREGKTHVAAMEPQAALGLIGNPVVDRIGKEVSERLRRVVDAVCG